MPDQLIAGKLADTSLPADDLDRRLTVAKPDESPGRSVTMNGSTSTILVSGKETNDRYCLIDMQIPEGGGAPPHRHDFEEMLTVLEGTIQFTFRGEAFTVSAPATINIPSNAPHSFTNTAGSTAHLLCLFSPAGIDEFFLAAADPLESRQSPVPRLSDAERAERRQKAKALAVRYRMEFLV